MKKHISLLLVLIILLSSNAYAVIEGDTPLFNSLETISIGDENYTNYQNALYNVDHNDDLDKEMKETLKSLIEEKHLQIINQNKYEENNIQLSTKSLPAFKKIATYSKKVSTIRHEANTLLAVGALSGGIGYFAKKVPLIGKGVSAAGATFSIAGSLLYLSVNNLKDNSSYTGENWFRWTNEKKYEYQVYTKTYVTYKGSRISSINQSGITSGDFNE